MKRLRNFISTSLYRRLAVVFLAIWWFFNIFTLIMVLRLGARLGAEGFDQLAGFIFLNNGILGTVVFMLALRSSVKPIKKLSDVARLVANGDFEVSVEVKKKDEIGRLANDFNEMVKELASLDKMRYEFVSNVSHEFRTPITSIRGFAKLIEESADENVEIKEYADTIVKESERLIELSTNLLRLSELDTQAIHHITEFSLAEQMRQVILFLEPLWSAKNIEFDIEFEEIDYTGDEELLRQVWINLIQNAIKFSNEGGVIKTVLYWYDEFIRIIITDSGVGISKEDIPRIFDRFYKGEAQGKTKGNGLGLAIVQKIIESEKGKITVNSEIGVGTAITVDLKYEY
jgi:signal transduction histidine kinase